MKLNNILFASVFTLLLLLILIVIKFTITYIFNYNIPDFLIGYICGYNFCYFYIRGFKIKTNKSTDKLE